MALALVAGLNLVPVASPIVEAAVSNITVWVGDPTPSGSSNYTINFTTTVKLTTAAGDTIIVDFPAGTTANTTISSITAATTWVNGTVASSATIGGTRVSVTPGADVDAGNVTIAFGNSTAPIDNPVPQGNYTLSVYTTREATAVNSSNYMIDTVVTTCSVHRENTSVNTLTDYNITFTPTTAMVEGDTITITFPATTTVPTSITGVSNVTINDTNLDSTSAYSVSGQTLTLTVPDNVDKDEATAVNITNLTGFKNPTTISSSWMVIIHTSKDRGLKTSTAYSTTAGNQSVITQINWSSYDAYVPNNTISAAFSIKTQDSYGNNATVDDDITFILGAGDGTFYDSDEGDTPITTIDIEDGNSTSADFYYKCTTPGTQYVTAYSGSHPSWTRANQTVIVNPMVQLWGGGVNAANYTTIQGAASAALLYDTIKVLPSTYEENFSVNTAHLTIESTAGKANTTIIGRIQVNTNANNLTIGGASGKGFTLKCGNTTEESILLNTGASDPEISYCTLNATNNRYASYGICTQSNALAGLTVTENAFIVTEKWDQGIRGAYDCELSNLTITNNTFTGTSSSSEIDNAAIELNKPNITATNITITGNTITTIANGVIIGSDQSNCGLITDSDAAMLNISDNTFDNCNRGIDLLNAAQAGNGTEQNVVMNTNTFINNTYGIAINYSMLTVSDDYWNVSNFTSVQHNNFNSSNPYGVYNAAKMKNNLPATLNWWGSADGPGGIGPGSGGNVTTYVTYSPWLNEPYPSSNTTAFSNITLQVNWNFISVPRKLSNATFGFLLSGQNISTSYAYEPATGWTLLNNSSPVDVLDGYWIDANAAGIINLTFVSTGQEVPASKNLTGEAWNAIGFSNLTAITASATLQSVNGSWSTVLGWNATAQSYDASIIYGMNDNTTMTPGKGYWVWMTANDTLAALSA